MQNILQALKIIAPEDLRILRAQYASDNNRQLAAQLARTAAKLPAGNCSNDADFVTQDSWDSTVEPTLKIHVLNDAGVEIRVDCHLRDSFLAFAGDTDNVMALWLPLTRNGQMTDDGHGGAPSHLQYTKIYPYNELIENIDTLDNDNNEYLAIPVGHNVRVGNRAGITAIPSVIHGQAPGYDLYYIIPTITDPKDILQELIDYINMLYNEKSVDAVDRTFIENLNNKINAETVTRQDLIRAAITLNSLPNENAYDSDGKLIWAPDLELAVRMWAPYAQRLAPPIAPNLPDSPQPSMYPIRQYSSPRPVRNNNESTPPLPPLPPLPANIRPTSVRRRLFEDAAPETDQPQSENDI